MNDDQRKLAVKSDLRRFLAENFIMGSQPAPIEDSDSFLEMHIMDSTGFLELVGFLEETYGIEIADEDMTPENLDSLDGVAEFVARKLG
jgi:acyl carrier protein